MSKASTEPGTPSSSKHQSYPGPRFLRLSQPSIHLPRSVNLPGTNTARPAKSKFSMPAKKSSLVARALPPTNAAAKSTNPLKPVLVLSSLKILPCDEEAVVRWDLRDAERHRTRTCRAAPFAAPDLVALGRCTVKLGAGRTNPEPRQ